MGNIIRPMHDQHFEFGIGWVVSGKTIKEKKKFRNYDNEW